MKTQISNILGFNKLLDNLSEKKLPLDIAYKMAKLRMAFAPEIKFYEERFNQYIDLYVDRDEEGHPIATEDGKGVRIKQEKVKECGEKLTELSQMQVDIPDITFKLSDFAGINFSVDDMSLLLPFIQE
jgi:hypothetical protein